MVVVPGMPAADQVLDGREGLGRGKIPRPILLQYIPDLLGINNVLDGLDRLLCGIVAGLIFLKRLLDHLVCPGGGYQHQTVASFYKGDMGQVPGLCQPVHVRLYAKSVVYEHVSILQRPHFGYARLPVVGFCSQR